MLSTAPLAELADACCVSVRHFSRAFKSSTGIPPHRWLFRRRIERAKTMLLGSAGGLLCGRRNILALTLFGRTRLVLQRSVPVTKMAPHSSWSARAASEAGAGHPITKPSGLMANGFFLMRSWRE
ncbi:helix-turn-helix domain-containing protein [Mesorhizobium sp. M0091]|uniref:helix-turn-helix domain-containing protein n=1 Tax=Mesorhizobium sp. M0091 TaxID=2956875 RepID=UPI00333D1D12